jgi:hypothetical protein
LIGHALNKGQVPEVRARHQSVMGSVFLASPQLTVCATYCRCRKLTVYPTLFLKRLKR